MDNSYITIRKARLGKRNTLEVAYVDNECNEVTLKGSSECHPDLVHALDALVPYLADLTEQREADRIDWSIPDCKENAELLRNLRVTGFTISSTETGRTLVLSGQRHLASSAIININTHALELDTDGEWSYMSLFLITLDSLIHEVTEYVNGKRLAVQNELDFEEANA